MSVDPQILLWISVACFTDSIKILKRFYKVIEYTSIFGSLLDFGFISIDFLYLEMIPHSGIIWALDGG